MRVQEMLMDNDMLETHDQQRHYTPLPKASRTDVHFPLTTPRKRAPSIASIADIIEQDGHSIGRLTIRAGDSPTPFTEDVSMEDAHRPKKSLDDLPLEVQGKILDYIFGDMHAVHVGTTSLRGKSVASLMRHPRRKAVSDFSLVSAAWRELVQARIYRHIKIKGTRAGIQESADFFCNHSHLTPYVRHIEFWVPVWGDKASLMTNESIEALPQNRSRQVRYPLAEQADEGLVPASDFLGFTFKLSVQTATLSEIFEHISAFFPNARVFSLEGGHCKKSNMIRQFPRVLFPGSPRSLARLPQIRTFAMRGAWNIMRQYSDWATIIAALPNIEEWHCGYAKPRYEAEVTINEILLWIPTRLRHVNISLDGMYSKDPSTLGSSSLSLAGGSNSSSSYSSNSHGCHAHLCERLGLILPQLESLSFTGKICECLFTSALNSLTYHQEEPRLQALEIVVKSCCRQRVMSIDPVTGDTVVDELGGVMADGAGITNLVFIKAFERLVLHAVDALAMFPLLKYIRIRFIDLDSPCTLLNPYWLLDGNQVYGVWNEEIVERLNEVRPETGYEELSDGIDVGFVKKATSSNDNSNTNHNSTGTGANTGTGAGMDGGDLIVPPADPNLMMQRDPAAGDMNLDRGRERDLSVGSLYPRFKPRSIKTSSYRVVAETRGS